MTGEPLIPATLVLAHGTQISTNGPGERYRQQIARIALDSMGQFVGLLDAQGNVLEINRVALDAAGVSLSQVEGKPLWATFWWQVSDEVIQTLQTAIGRAGQGESVRWDTPIFGRAGGKETIVIDASLSPVRDEQGKVVFITVEGRDITEKKALERQIGLEREKARRLYDTILSNTPDLAYVFDLHHRFIYANKALLAMWGRTWEEAVGKNCLELGYAPWHAAMHDREIEQVIATRKPIRGEVPFTGTNGRRVYDYIFVPVMGPSGEVEAIAGTTRDITERTQAEDALRRSEERLRAFVTATSNAVYSMSADWSEMHQLEGKAFIADTEETTRDWLQKYIHPDDQDRLMSVAAEAMRTKNTFELEHRVLRLDGTLGWTLSRAVPVLGADGEIVEWFGAAADVTERRRAEEARHRLAAIVESSDDAIVGKDLKGIVTSWNAAAERIFGYTAEEMIGRSITTIIPPELHKDEQAILATIGRGDRIRHFETERVKKNGERIEVALTISPVRDETGAIIGAAKIARDITQQKKTEHALHTSERLASVGRLAATVAHEINNPLEAVTNLIYLARRSGDAGEVQNFLAAAEEELSRVSHLTKQTLGFYRYSSAASPTNLGRMVTSLVSVFSSRIRNKEIEITSEIRQAPEIIGVAGEIRQLLANLISNSIDAVPIGGQIRVRLSAANEKSGEHRSGVRLTVADSGSGIPAEIRSRLFEPFFTTKKDVGTGLGLWVCKGIVDKHCGRIQVKSNTTPGKSWTVFSVFLPEESRELMIEQRLKAAV
jgi:PAS domain S-box-containing protein